MVPWQVSPRLHDDAKRRSVLGFMAALSLAGLALAAAACSADVPDQSVAVAPRQPVAAAGVRQLLVGAQTHLATNEKNYQLAATEHWLSKLGFTAFRDDAVMTRERYRKPTDSTYFDPTQDSLLNATAGRARPLFSLVYGDPSLEGGIQPLDVQTQQAFASFSAGVAKHMPGSRPLVEIWNEWNLGTGTTQNRPGAPEDYVRLVNVTAPAIRRARPDAVILAGAATNEVDDWHWTLAALRGGMAANIDGVTLHPYDYCEQPPKRTAAHIVQQLDVLHEAMQGIPGAGRLPIYISEVGWPSEDMKCFVSEGDAAAYSAQLILEADLRPWIAGIWFYELKDSLKSNPSDREAHFGILDKNYAPKPRACSIPAAIALISSSQPVGRTIPALGVVRIDFQNADGSVSSALWSESATVKAAFSANTPGRQFCESGEGRTSDVLGDMPVVFVSHDGRPAKIQIRVGT